MQAIKQSKLLLVLMVIIAFFSSFGLFMQPVNAYSAASVDTQGVFYAKIECELCKSNGTPVVHKMLKSTYNKHYKNFWLDSNKYQVKCNLCGANHCKFAMQEKPIFKLAYNVCVGANSDFATYKSITTDEDAGSTLFQVLRFDQSTQGGTITFVQGALYQGLGTVGLFIIAIYFVLELGEGAMEDKLTYEFFLFLAVKALIAIVIVTNAPEWIVLGLQTMTDIFDQLSATVSGTGTYLFQVGYCKFDRLFVQDASFWSALGEMITDAIFCIFIMITYVFTFGIAWARVFEIMVRIAFAPIGLADFYHGGTKCLAVRYFKKLLASVLQGSCMMAVILSYQVISNAIRGEQRGPIIGVILGLAVITAITQTSEIATDAIGE